MASKEDSTEDSTKDSTTTSRKRLSFETGLEFDEYESVSIAHVKFHIGHFTID